MRAIVAMVLTSVLISCAAEAATTVTNLFEARTFKDAEGKTLPYRLLKPEPFDPNQAYPLLLFFHGAGERGKDNAAQLKNGVGVFAKEENRKKFPCFVVAPQCEQNAMWVNTPWSLDAHTQPEKVTEGMRLSMALLPTLQKEFKIDPKRMYVAGVSMGGFGTWDVITRYPGVFAAAIPCCGGADEKTAEKLAKFPIWAFHGDKDTVVKTSRSRNMIAALKKAGGEPKYTEYPGVGHDSWNKAFSEPELLPWLFAQKQ